MWAKCAATGVLIALCAAASPAVAMHEETAADVENLRRRIEALEQEKAEPREVPAPAVAWAERLHFSGLLEVEAAYEHAEGGEESSELTLATAQLGVEARVTKQVGGHLVLLYEEGKTDGIEVDEAVIVLTLLDSRLAMAAGKQYLPFGKFNSHLVTDPLTLDLGETNDTALTLRWSDGNTYEFSLAVFNGEADRAGHNDAIDSWVASIRMTPREGIAFGASYLSDLAESDLGLVQDDPVLGNIFDDAIPAAACFVSLGFGPLTIEGEHLTALDKFDPAVVALGTDLSGRRPRAWNLEVAVVPTEGWEVAARAEEGRDFRDDLVRYGAAVSHAIFPQTIVALEYLRGDAKVPENDPVHTVTAQLAMNF